MDFYKPDQLMMNLRSLKAFSYTLYFSFFSFFFFFFFLDASELQNQYNFLAAPHTTIIPTHKKRAEDESDNRIRGEWKGEGGVEE